MPTGEDILQQALQLRGYAEDWDGPSAPGRDARLRRGLAAVNQAYCDLWYIEARGEFRPLTALSDRVELSARGARDILPYGTAMFLAQTEGDGDNQALYAGLYNQKRSGAEARRQRVVSSLFGEERPCGFRS